MEDEKRVHIEICMDSLLVFSPEPERLNLIHQESHDKSACAATVLEAAQPRRWPASHQDSRVGWIRSGDEKAQAQCQSNAA